MTMLQDLRDLCSAFEARTRSNGDTFIALCDGAPDWMTGIVRRCHDALGYGLPDDLIYRDVPRMAAALSYTFQDDEDADLIGLVQDAAYELVPDATWTRLQWLASHLHRAGLLDELIEERGWPKDGISDAIAWAMSAELEQIGYVICNALEERADD